MSKKQVQMKTWPYAVMALIFSAGGYSHAAETATNNITSVRRIGGPMADIGESVGTLRLDDAIEMAKHQNPRLLMALAKVETSEGERIEAGLWENPELEIYSEEIPVDSGGFSAAKNMVGISQTVPFPGKKHLDRRVGDLRIEQRRNAYRATELEVVRDVKIAFYRVLAAQQGVVIYEELSELSKSLAETAGKRLSAGEAPAQELLRAEIERGRALTEAERSKGGLAEARQRLATLLGSKAPLQVSLSGMLLAGNNDAAPTNRHHDTLQLHPRMVQADQGIRAAEAAYDRSRKNPLPDVTIAAAFGSRDSEVEGSENLAELSVSLPLPIVDRGQGSRRTSAGNLAAARAHRATIEQELFEEYRNARTRLMAATKGVDRYREAILPRIDKALSLMQRGFQEGKFSFIDLLDTQRTVAETRLRYQEALFELNAAEATLDSLMVRADMNQEKR